MKRKKLMLSTLIGASLLGSLNIQAFALDNKNEPLTEISINETEMSTESEISEKNLDVNQLSENTYIGPSERSFNSITLSSWVATPGPNTTGYYQKFTRTGFQKYIYKGVVLYNYHGFIKSYTDKTFEVLTDFFTMNGKLYYSDKFGNSKIGLELIDGKYYFFNENLLDPYAIKGWKTIGAYTYYFDTDYQAVTGPKLIDGKVYFFNDVGHLLKGLVEEDGKTYYFNPNTGEQITGWYSFNDNESRYYFDPLNGGAAHEGWYYGNSRGKMYFDDRGKMAKGVTKIGDERYLFLTARNDYNACLTTGWYSDGPKRYYFDPQNEGKAVRNQTKFIDGRSYTFDNEGCLVR